MKSLLSWFLLIVSIAVLVSSCAKSDDSKTANETETETTTPGSGVFVAVGLSRTIVRSTDNGTNWNNMTIEAGAENIYGVTFGNNTFVAVGTSANIVRSTDNGTNWRSRVIPR